jgi:hypothetical protein
MARVSGIGERGRMRWTKGLLAPARLGLRATAGPAGARAALLLYQQRRHPLLATAATRARSLALSHGLGRRCRPPVDGFDELCALLGVAPDGAAAIHSWLADRLIIYIIGLRGSVVVKVGTRLDAGLSTEAELLDRLGGSAGPVRVPAVRWHGEWRENFVLATEAIRLGDRRGDLGLEEAASIATALSLGSAGVGPLVHGDLTPWNALRTPNGVALVDWERGRMKREPLFDLAHFVVTCGALLRRDQPARAVSQLTAPGSPGWRHLVSLDLDPLTAPSLLQDYLARTWDDNEASWEYRRALLRELRVAWAGTPPSAARLAAAAAGHDPTGAAQP